MGKSKRIQKQTTENVQKDSLLYQIYQLAQSLNKQKFWEAMVSEIIISPNKGFILIPQTGAKEIILGKKPLFEKSFKILTKFYQKILPQVGWKVYKSIDLRYDHQIVCKK